MNVPRRRLRKWLQCQQLDISHYWVLEEVRLRSPPAGIRERAVEASWTIGGAFEIDAYDASAALSDLLSRRFIQEVTPDVLEGIKRTLMSPPGVIAPADILLPDLGEVAFTQKGARLVIALYADLFHASASAEYVDDVTPGGSGRIYARTIQRLSDGILNNRRFIRSLDDIGPPYGIGPWRSEWWHLHLSGWAVDIQCSESS